MRNKREREREGKKEGETLTSSAMLPESSLISWAQSEKKRSRSNRSNVENKSGIFAYFAIPSYYYSIIKFAR